MAPVIPGAQLDTLMVRVMEGTLVLLDDRGDIARYPQEGRFQGRHVSGRVVRSDDSLTIETAGADWQRIETFYRDGDRLVLINELRDRRRRSVKVRTVYERPGRLAATNPQRAADVPEREAIRIVPPQRRHRELLSGRVEAQTLIIDPLIVAVDFEAIVTAPRSATLERVDFYRGDQQAASVHDFGDQATRGPTGTVTVDARMEYRPADGFVRVSATLADGRSMEDAELVQGADYRSEIDVQLVQLQVLVTDGDGNPVSGLKPGDFKIREGGRRRRPEALLRARDVPLVLGLAIDSSDSMLRIWTELTDVAAGFLDATLATGDRAFLVDFDDTVSLRQPLTQDNALLLRGIDRLIPFGGTAINDGILFSLLQYGREPGRRALVVVTDGDDEHSRSRPEQSADYAASLGLPIYFIELDPTATRTETKDGWVVTDVSAALRRKKARKRLERISRQTGGRLFHITLASEDPPWTEQIEQVFDQIETDLRHQHVLTYYSDRPPGTAVNPQVHLTRPGLRLQSAVPLVD